MANDWKTMSAIERTDYLLKKLNGIEATLSNLIFDTRLAQRVEKSEATVKEIAKDLQAFRQKMIGSRV